jgi:hypothetical protein
LAKATDFVTLDSNKLECPVPRPRQIFAIGINYKAHAAEMNHGLPKEPLVFTKFPSSLNSPFGQINLTGEKCDYEAELVAIIAKPGRNISVADAWSHVAGLCVGQDFSDRELQYANTPPQFSLGKSRAGFTAIGPWITDAATLSTRANLEMTCRVSGEVMQNTQTDDMRLNRANRNPTAAPVDSSFIITSSFGLLSTPEHRITNELTLNSELKVIERGFLDLATLRALLRADVPMSSWQQDDPILSDL